MRKKNLIPPAGLQQFQRDFGGFLRDPENVSLPEGIPIRAGKTYQELVFNNICSFLDACFPICQKVISSAVWRDLVRDFFRTGTSDNPMFTSIPAQFVEYLQTEPAGFDLPIWFAELAHYEWVELAVDIDGGKVTTTADNLLDTLETKITDYLTGKGQLSLLLNPTLHSLHYQWPVHQIGANYQPEQPEETFIFVLRDYQHQPRFIVANAMTVVLVAFLSEPPESEENLSLLHQFAAQIGFADEQQLLQFIVPLLADFVRQDMFTLREEKK